jgi:hypothetical protein
MVAEARGPLLRQGSRHGGQGEERAEDDHGRAGRGGAPAREGGMGHGR